jgi:hypothetical protein
MKTQLPQVPEAFAACHTLLAPDGKHAVCFQPCGDHQAWTGEYLLEGGQWVRQKAGFNWIGILRDRYRTFLTKGYRKP